MGRRSGGAGTLGRGGVCCALLVLLLASLPGCDERTTPRRTSLVVATGRDAISLDPAALSDTESMHAVMQVFDTLVRFNTQDGGAQPSLALSWTQSKDRKTWTFRLRPGVLFHDGTPLTADAVVFSFERQRDQAHPFHHGNFIYWKSSFSNITQVVKVDRLTVRIHLDRPYAPFLHMVAMYPLSIVSPTAMRKLGREFATRPVGSGPFKFSKWTPGRRIVLLRNPNYWERGRPRVDRLVIEVVPDSGHRLMTLESKHVDVAYGLSPADRRLVSLHPGLRLHSLDGNNVAYLAMNTRRPPFDDLRVRLAVNHAVNKRALVKLVYQGQAEPAIGPLPPRTLGYKPDLPVYGYNPNRASKLLEQAGYAPTRRPRLLVMANPRSYVSSPVLAARMIASNLAAVGMETELVIKPFKEFLVATQRGDHDLCLGGWTGDNGDPDNFLSMLLGRGSSRNLAKFDNAQLQFLLGAALQEHSRKSREELYHRALKIVASYAPWVPLAHSKVVTAHHHSLRGIKANPFTSIYFWTDAYRKGPR